MLAEVQQQSNGDELTFPEGWTQSDTSVRFFNLCGPAWAALDYKINPWASLDDGLWEFATDKCALLPQLARTAALLASSGVQC